MKKVKYKIEYYLFIFFKMLVGILPKVIMKNILNSLSYLYMLIDRRHLKVIYQNIDFSFGGKLNLSQKEKISREVYRNLFYNVYEMIKNRQIKKEDMLLKIKHINGFEYLKECLDKKEKIIFISAHYGNWELLSHYLSQYSKITVVGRKLNNKFLNKELYKLRETEDIEMLEKSEAAKGMIKALKENRMLGLVIDQNVNEKGGVLTKFFNKEVYFINSAAKLAIKQKAVILPMYLNIDDLGEYTLDIKETIRVNKVTTKEEEKEEEKKLVQKYASSMEEQIKKNKNQWFWVHKRYKTNFPHIYSK